MAEGSLADTYAAAVRHGLVDPAGATLVGVVRRPSPRFSALVDENRTALGPPPGLLDEVHERRRDLGMAGLCEEEAHNSACEQVEFETRYRAAIERDADAQAAIESLATRLLDGRDLWLVCAETTARKRSHRSTLREMVAERLDSTTGE